MESSINYARHDREEAQPRRGEDFITPEAACWWSLGWSRLEGGPELWELLLGLELDMAREEHGEELLRQEGLSLVGVCAMERGA